jgi:hypothetical protein
MIEHIKLYGTTDSSGDLTVTSTVGVEGFLHAVEWIDGAFADGVDAVLSVDRNDNAADVTLLTLTDANSDAMYYPQTPAQDNVGTAVTFDGTNEIYTRQIVNGLLKLVVSDGGDTKAGGCIVYVEV